MYQGKYDYGLVIPTSTIPESSFVWSSLIKPLSAKEYSSKLNMLTSCAEGTHNSHTS